MLKLKKKNIQILLQARTNSKRLHAKVLMRLCNDELVIMCYKRLKKSNLNITVVIPANKKDNYLAKVLKKNKINFFRGSEYNVLKRFRDATKKMDPEDIIIRTTADNPLVDGFFINKILSIYEKYNLNYFSAHDNFTHIPYGLQAEVFKVKHLREKSILKLDKQHVTQSIRKRYLSKKINLNQNNLKKFSKLRVTIDNLDDYKFMSKLFKLSYKNRYASYEKIIKNIKKISKQNLQFKS